MPHIGALEFKSPSFIKTKHKHKSLDFLKLLLLLFDGLTDTISNLFTSSTHTVNQDWQAKSNQEQLRMRSRRYQRKQPGSSQTVSHRSGREKRRWEGGRDDIRAKAKNPGLTGFSLPWHNNARLATFASSQVVSAPRSLNGAGYGTAFTDPQHQLQSLRVGKCRVYQTPLCYRCQHQPNPETHLFYFLKKHPGLSFRLISWTADCHKVPCLCTPAHA